MSNNMTTWRAELVQARALGEDASEVVEVSPNDEVLDIAFDPGYGWSQGPEVLIWTVERVYFPVVYDGAEWLRSAPRNPPADPQGHVGGE
jgi:hypothetical protein